MSAADYLSSDQFGNGAVWRPAHEGGKAAPAQQGAEPLRTRLDPGHTDARPLKTITLTAPVGITRKFGGNGGLD